MSPLMLPLIKGILHQHLVTIATLLMFVDIDILTTLFQAPKVICFGIELNFEEMELTPVHIEKLAELLRPPEPEILQGNDLTSSGLHSEVEITSNRKGEPDESKVKRGPKTIEEFEEQEAKEAEELTRAGGGIDGRKPPQYTMNYQQAVAAEDVYLQIGHKTPGTASCEHLIVRVKMPGDKMENIDLNVDTATVTIDSSRYHLSLPLPHNIDPDRSKANWDSTSDTLILTLKLDREFDFVNF